MSRGVAGAFSGVAVAPLERIHEPHPEVHLVFQTVLYTALALGGLVIANAHRRSALWAFAAPTAAFLASSVLVQWAPLMPMWGEASTIVGVGGLLMGLATLAAQVAAGAMAGIPAGPASDVCTRPVQLDRTGVCFANRPS